MPDPTTWAVDALSLPWESLEAYAFPSSLPAHQGDLQSDGSRLSQNDSNCSRVAQHALVLGPGESITSDSLQASTAGESGDNRTRALWQQELRLLRDSQPEPFTSQSGPCLSNGVTQTRWTSGRPL